MKRVERFMLKGEGRRKALKVALGAAFALSGSASAKEASKEEKKTEVRKMAKETLVRSYHCSRRHAVVGSRVYVLPTGCTTVVIDNDELCRT